MCYCFWVVVSWLSKLLACRAEISLNVEFPGMLLSAHVKVSVVFFAAHVTPYFCFSVCNQKVCLEGRSTRPVSAVCITFVAWEMCMYYTWADDNNIIASVCVCTFEDAYLFSNATHWFHTPVAQTSNQTCIHMSTLTLFIHAYQCRISALTQVCTPYTQRSIQTQACRFSIYTQVGLVYIRVHYFLFHDSDAFPCRSLLLRLFHQSKRSISPSWWIALLEVLLSLQALRWDPSHERVFACQYYMCMCLRACSCTVCINMHVQFCVVGVCQYMYAGASLDSHARVSLCKYACHVLMSVCL